MTNLFQGSYDVGVYIFVIKNAIQVVNTLNKIISIQNIKNVVKVISCHD